MKLDVSGPRPAPGVEGDLMQIFGWKSLDLGRAMTEQYDQEHLKAIIRLGKRMEGLSEALDRARSEVEAEEAERAGDQPFIDGIRRDLESRATISRERWITAATLAARRYGLGSAHNVADMIKWSESTVMRRWREVRRPGEEWPNPC